MLDRLPAAPTVPGPIRLLAAYRSTETLLRDLSRALNQGQTLLKADSGLPAGTHIVLVMHTPSLSAPIEVQGVVTSCRPKGRKMAMTLRYDFDPEPHRSRLREAMAELKRHNRRPRKEPRVPLALRTDARALLRGLSATVSNASRAGARLELVGPRLPVVAPGDRQPDGEPPARAPGARGDVGGIAAAVRKDAAAGGGRTLPWALTDLEAAHPGDPPLRRCEAGAPTGLPGKAPRTHPATLIRFYPPDSPKRTK
jgi:hypothetical protein